MTETPAAAPTTTEPQAPAQWTEAEHLAALNRINSIQDTLNSLRSAIPSITRPLASFQPSRAGPTTPEERRKRKEMALAALREAGQKSAGDLKRLKEEWEGESMKEVRERVQASMKEDGDTRAGRVRVEGEGDSRGW